MNFSLLQKKLFFFSALLLTIFTTQARFLTSQFYYQIKIYHLKTAEQESALDQYLKAAYIPALHRAGISSVGVFKPKVVDTSGLSVYVFVPFKSLNEFLKLEPTLEKDQEYLTAAKDYLEAAYNKAPYNRIESILLKAFKAMPAPANPVLTSAKSDRVYELRSYESPTEKLGLNKIGMFNDAEVAMFTKLNFNAVFYGQVISGSRMPNLMYLTTFNNKDDRDKHWEAFGPLYKTISGLAQYQNNVNKYIITFLYPVEYSDI